MLSHFFTGAILEPNSAYQCLWRRKCFVPRLESRSVEDTWKPYLGAGACWADWKSQDWAQSKTWTCWKVQKQSWSFLQWSQKTYLGTWDSNSRKYYRWRGGIWGSATHSDATRKPVLYNPLITSSYLRCILWFLNPKYKKEDENSWFYFNFSIRLSSSILNISSLTNRVKAYFFEKFSLTLFTLISFLLKCVIEVIFSK